MEISRAFSTKNHTKRVESAGYFSHSLKTGPEGSGMKQVVLVEAILAEHGINVPEAPRSMGSCARVERVMIVKAKIILPCQPPE